MLYLVSRHGKTDWSAGMVESTMKRYPTTKDLGSWGYAEPLYLSGQYLVYKRTRDPRYLQYIKDWVDSHVDTNGVVTSANGKAKCARSSLIISTACSPRIFC
ncbi:MAG TPA: glycoside hydrolase family 88 protein [Pyrinomonadaceae bacterium]|nr:glycoside hydrolase family 88 protein [Pyrinomonadaceae bacterium]